MLGSGNPEPALHFALLSDTIHRTWNISIRILNRRILLTDMTTQVERPRSQAYFGTASPNRVVLLECTRCMIFSSSMIKEISRLSFSLILGAIYEQSTSTYYCGR